MIVTSLTAPLAPARAGMVRWRAGLLFAAAAGLLSARIPAAVPTMAFAALAMFAGLRMLRRRTPSEDATASAPRATGAGAVLGAVTGFLGVGGGFLAVPALVTALAAPMSAAVGTSLPVIIANEAVALAARASTQVSLDWSLIMPFIATAVLGACDGKRLSAKDQPAGLQRVFGTLLLTVAAVMATGVLLWKTRGASRGRPVVGAFAAGPTGCENSQARERNSFSSRERICVESCTCGSSLVMHCCRPVAMIENPARSSALETADSCVTTSSQSRPSSIILITPAS